MSVVRNFISLKIITLAEANLWMLLIVWVFLVTAGLWSVFSRPLSIVKKISWGIVIICLPIIGLLLYSLQCICSAEWEVARRMGFLSKSKKKIVEAINSSQD